MSQLPDPTNPAEAVNAALSGIKQALKAGKDIQQTAAEVNDFLDAEAKARIAFKKRQQQIARRGDTIWVDARQEWDIIRKMREAEAGMYREVEREFGKQAVAEVKSLIIRMRKEHRELNDEFYRERMQSRKEWGVLLLLAAIIYGVFKQTGVW
jgi:hypothetical protein